MGPRLSTGGNLTESWRGKGGVFALQWGPVSRRGGTRMIACSSIGSTSASMGPRLSTGGNRGRADFVVVNEAQLQWGPVSRRGGTCRFRSGSWDEVARFNGAPSLDGGEHRVDAQRLIDG